MQAEAPALTNGHQLQRVDFARGRPRRCHEPAFPERDALTDEARPSSGLGDEADILAVGFARGAQVEVGGDSADLVPLSAPR